jgi:hypothetical protein
VDWLQPQGFSGVSAERAGQLWFRTVPGPNRPASPISKAAQGLSSNVVELVEDFDKDTYRAVYAVRLHAAVYVLHAFKKKSKQGSKTPQSDIDLIRRRLRDAEADHAARLKEDKT